MSVRSTPRLKMAAALILCLAGAGGASAQTSAASSASFNAGYGRTPGQENRQVAVSSYGVRDANGNLSL